MEREMVPNASTWNLLHTLQVQIKVPSYRKGC